MVDDDESDRLSFKSDSSFNDFKSTKEITGDIDHDLIGHEDWSAFRKWFDNPKELETFKTVQKILYKKFNNEERKRQAYLLKYFLHNGEYPRTQLPESNKTVEELLQRPSALHKVDNINCFKLGAALFVGKDIIDEFDEMWRFAAKIDSDLSARMLNALQEGGPDVSSSFRKKNQEGRVATFFTKGGHMETETVPSQLNDHGDHGIIYLDPTTAFIDRSMNAAFVLPREGGLHEVGHVTESIYFPVDYDVRIQTPAGLWTNHEEIHQIKGPERFFIEKQGRVARESHQGIPLSVKDFTSLEVGLRVYSGKTDYQVKEELHVAGTISSYNTTASRLTIATTGSQHVTFNALEIEYLLSEDSSDRAIKRAEASLKEASDNQDIVSITKKKGEIPAFKNHSDELREMLEPTAEEDEEIFHDIIPGGFTKISQFSQHQFNLHQGLANDSEKCRHSELIREFIDKEKYSSLPRPSKTTHNMNSLFEESAAPLQIDGATFHVFGNLLIDEKCLDQFKNACTNLEANLVGEPIRHYLSALRGGASNISFPAMGKVPAQPAQPAQTIIRASEDAASIHISCKFSPTSQAEYLLPQGNLQFKAKTQLDDRSSLESLRVLQAIIKAQRLLYHPLASQTLLRTANDKYGNEFERGITKDLQRAMKGEIQAAIFSHGSYKFEETDFGKSPQHSLNITPVATLSPDDKIRLREKHDLQNGNYREKNIRSGAPVGGFTYLFERPDKSWVVKVDGGGKSKISVLTESQLAGRIGAPGKKEAGFITGRSEAHGREGFSR
ncbi:MAG: hypothetical protein V4568_02545 [Pseudomonadota bacterium]